LSVRAFLHGAAQRVHPPQHLAPPVAGLGPIYVVAAAICGALFLWGSIDLGKEPTPQRSMRLFAFSISYVTLLFGALTVDVLVRHGL